jgi:hypothetical protein
LTVGVVEEVGMDEYKTNNCGRGLSVAHFRDPPPAHPIACIVFTGEARYVTNRRFIEASAEVPGSTGGFTFFFCSQIRGLKVTEVG